MTTPATDRVIYEVECLVDPSVAGDFDRWLPGHVREVLSCPGVTGAEIQSPAGAGGRAMRRCQYRLQDAAALQHYLREDAPRLRADAMSRFGSKVTFTRRVLTPTPVATALPVKPFTCRNCGAPVPGHYCAECGQSRHIHVLSMHEVLGDVTHSLLHLDSRAWRTLRSLVLRPGELTREFIAGRHQHYLPPFRLYLVLSVAFFALSAMLPQADLIRVEDQAVVAPIRIGPAAGRDATGTAATPASTTAECNIDLDLPGVRRLNPAFNRACEKVRADGGRRLGEIFLHTAPKLMFIFLPLAAAVAMLFYWRPRRLYTEHLVLFLHVHAFVFLWLSVNAVIESVVSLKPPGAGLLGVASLLLALYVPWYVYRAMRVVYGQGRALTLAKFLVISSLYFVLLATTMVAGFLYSMLSL